jgi:hypothetical protein
LRAKRSNPALPQQRKLDCFVASLLAMTGSNSELIDSLAAFAADLFHFATFDASFAPCF